MLHQNLLEVIRLATLAVAGQSYALLADGTTMTIRPAGPGDFEPVKQLHEAMSPGNLYFRFFSASKASAEREARRVCLEGGPGRVALLGLLGDAVVGVASYELTTDPAAAEIALAVADDMHRHGIATLLLEHLVSLARARSVQVLVAEVLPDNYAVLRVLSDAGLAVHRRFDNGVVELSMPVPRNAALSEASTWLDAMAGREKQADVASLEPLLAPRSAAVVGAGHRPGSVGRTILLNIRDAGFAGPLYRRAAGGPRSGRGGGTRGRRRGGGAGVRAARGRVLGRRYLGLDAVAGIGPAGGDPARQHAPGRLGVLRRRGARDRAGCHVRSPAPFARARGPGGPVRSGRCGADRAVLPAGHRDLLGRLGRRQAGRIGL
jgi:GNAT superfamily N-acetyltransferase